MGEALLSAVLPTLFEKLASPVIKELGKLYGVGGEIAKLRRTVERIQAMLHDSEQKEELVVGGHQATLWLREIRTALYAAEDLVDEFEHEGLRRKVSAEGRHGAGGGSCLAIPLVSGKLCKLCSCLTPRAVSFRYQMARKVDDLRRKLDEISKEKKDLKLGRILSSVKANLSEADGGPPAETTALLGTPEVFGRDEVKNKLVELLLTTTQLDPVGPSTTSSSSLLPVHPTNFSVISVVGMGGLGKTTLAQLVYNTEQVLNHFPTRIWVCVSLDFNPKKLTKQILEHLVDTQSNIPNRDNLNVLQQDLSERLKEKRFLLILDDVWEEDQNKWKAFSAPLVEGGTGSKILITTRNANVADILRPKKIELQTLSFDDSWSLFKTYAFTHAHSSKYQILEPIGKHIVNKLQGVPLAVVVIGGLLGSETDERKWRDVLDSKLWELEQGGHGILPALKLSYKFLPFHLRKCFSYCCVWPKTTHFSIHELVQLWMAQGYVRTQGNRSVQDVGVDYVEELFNRSLLQLSYDRYVVHDLLHDLGQQILEQECYTIEPDQVVQEIPKDADSKVHLFVSYPETLENMSEVLCKFKSLRTLAFWLSSVPYQLPIDMFHMVKGLRVFGVAYSSIDALPDSIGYLKHLRCLDLRFTNIEYLPETLCSLYNLQTLRLEGCDKLRVLPSGMSSLVNLHYLEARAELVSKVTQIGKLIHLQYLYVFSVSEENKNRLGDLKNMRELHGSLCIENLERVTSTTGIEVAEARILKNMQYLESLKLQWTGGQNVGQTSNYLVESTIECLQPPQQLKALTVISYAGTKFPGWMNNVSLPSLVYLHLHSCTNLNHLLPLMKLHSLRTLNISGCPQLKELPQLPPALENLILQEVGLVALPNMLHQLPLCCLDLCQLPEIKQLPLLPFTLRELAIEGVGLQALPELCQGSYEMSTSTRTRRRGPNIDDEDKSSEHFGEPKLSVLKIHACPRMTSLDVGMLKQYHLRHLRVLIIQDCEELVNWPDGGGFQRTLLHSLAEELSIKRCPKLTALPEGTKLHPSLKKLVVKDSHMVLKNQLMFGHVHNVEDVFVRMHYPQMEQCASEALQHIRAVDRLEIQYCIQADGDDELGRGPPPPVDVVGGGAKPPVVVFLYDRMWDWDYRLVDKYMARLAQLRILGRRKDGGRRHAAADDCVGTVGSTGDDDDEEKHRHDHCDEYNCWPPTEVLQRCLGGHPWISSLRHLVFRDIPGGELIISKDAPHAEQYQDHPIPPLPSLQQLKFLDCREMRKLPIEMMLSDTTVLKRLVICNCPELTWSSVDAGIQSLSSLEVLEIMGCPKLLLEIVSPPPPSSSSSPGGMKSNNSVVHREDVRSSPEGAAGLLCLRKVYVDDLKLLTRWLSVDHNILTSLRVLHLIKSELASLMAPAEEWVLRTLAPSLRRLDINDCPNLEVLPTDLRGLLPNLKSLRISNCPKLCRLPVGRLPASLDELAIVECPKMEELADSRQKMADLRRSIPVCIINGVYISGSFTKMLELRAHWELRP